MKPLPFRSVALLCVCVFAFRSSEAQTPARPSAKAVPTAMKYRCSRPMSKHFTDSSSYRTFKTVDYTPPNELQSWSVANDLQSYAATVDGEVTLECVLSIDEKGVIKNVKIVKNSAGSEKIKTLLTGTKTAGPSYVRNTAVACVVPCVIHISNHKVTIS